VVSVRAAAQSVAASGGPCSLRRSPLDPGRLCGGMWKATGSKELCGDQGDGFPGSLPLLHQLRIWAIWPMPIATYVRYQIEQRRPQGGCKLFDSWAGHVQPPRIYDVFAAPLTRTGVRSGGRHPPNTPLISLFSELPGLAGAHVTRVDSISLDWTAWIWPWPCPPAGIISGCAGQCGSGAVFWHPGAIRPG